MNVVNQVNIENSKAQMRRGILELCILSMIAGNEMYPSDIIKGLKEANVLVVEGTLYPLLNRLKNGGYLTYRWVESKSGPPRKYYVLTQEGEDFKTELQNTWQELVHAVNLTAQPSSSQGESKNNEPLNNLQTLIIDNNPEE